MVAHFAGKYLTVDHHHGEIIVNVEQRTLLDGDIARVIGDQVERLVAENGVLHVYLNLANVEALGSLTLAMFLSLSRKLGALGSKLTLFNLGKPIYQVIRTTGLDQLLSIQQTAWVPAEEEGNAPGEEKLSRPTVVVGGLRPEQAREVKKMLPGHLSVVCVTDCGALKRHCLAQMPLVVVLPLLWVTAPSTSAEVKQFIREQGHCCALLVYGDTRAVPLGLIYQTLALGARKVLNEAEPMFPKALRQTVERLLAEHQAQREEQAQLGGQFAQFGLIGESAPLQAVFRRARRAAEFSDMPVLILGETGTGKQRLAEAIHRLDPQRKNKPFLTVNCSAISKSLAESELFGHIRGAFSGAGAERLGLFRSANGGTLLLDEIGELDLELQPKLLRVLQDRHLLPVGSDYEHPVDVRIIAATNRPLDVMVAEKKFRADLYQRLNVFQIRIPPLRERLDDIDAQARHFLSLYQPGAGQPVQDLDERAREALRLLPWEGNTRQLENVLRETLAHRPSGKQIQVEDLPGWALERLSEVLLRAHPEHPAHPAPHRAPDQQAQPLNEALDNYERQLVVEALRRNRGNRTRAAAELGLTPRTLFNKIKKYHLDEGAGPGEEKPEAR